MGTIHLMVFFCLGIFHLSFSKECSGCSKTIDVNDPANVKYLSEKLENETPKGTKDGEQTELVRIKDIHRKVVKGLIYTYDFEARGLNSNSLYECKLDAFQQEWLGVEEIQEYSCKIVPSIEQERSFSEEELSTDFDNSFDPISLKINKKKYAICMAKAAIKCHKQK